MDNSEGDPAELQGMQQSVLEQATIGKTNEKMRSVLESSIFEKLNRFKRNNVSIYNDDVLNLYKKWHTLA